MLSKIVSPGDRLELVKHVSEKEMQEPIQEQLALDNTLISQVYDIIDDTQLRIAMPIVEGHALPLPLNQRFDVSFFTKKGLYKSVVTILERYEENGLYILVVELIYELKKYQRRQYYRLECVMEIEYVSVGEDFLKGEINDDIVKRKFEEHQSRKAVLMDISGGGMRFTSKEKLDENAVILIKLDIHVSNNKSLYAVMGKVLFSGKVSESSEIYEQRIEYCEIEGQARETIIKYIFETERKMRQR